MKTSKSSIEQALAAIRSSRFQHPDDQLLECFLQDSVGPEATARYVLQRYSDGQEGYDLRALSSEW
jgi:hypothetical protein